MVKNLTDKTNEEIHFQCGEKVRKLFRYYNKLINETREDIKLIDSYDKQKFEDLIELSESCSTNCFNKIMYTEEENSKSHVQLNKISRQA